MAITYTVTVDILSFPDSPAAVRGDVLTAERVAPYLPRLLDVGAVAVHDASPDPVMTDPGDEQPAPAKRARK
jgi:hypothetical protein